MKSVVILSGGLDSAVALAQAVAEHGSHRVQALTFHYGSKCQVSPGDVPPFSPKMIHSFRPR